jgi:uncharacterized protein YkwD
MLLLYIQYMGVMMKRVIFLTIVAFFLEGCGGDIGSNFDNETSNYNSDTSISSDEIREAIRNGKVESYSVDSPLADKMLAVINYVRSKKIKCNDEEGVQSPSHKLLWSTELENAAYEHSKDMLSVDSLSHLGSGTDSDTTGQSFDPPRESRFYERMKYNGYYGTMYMENIGDVKVRGGTVPEDYWINMIVLWIKSREGHCSILLNHNLDKVGMAEAKNSSNTKVYYTADFGKD